jgi:hypothetical protein
LVRVVGIAALVAPTLSRIGVWRGDYPASISDGNNWQMPPFRFNQV